MTNVIKKYKSYSLIEVIAAIAIILSIVAGVTVLNNTALRNTTLAKHRLQAAFFAQEQIEILRNMRDSGIYNTTGGDWDIYFGNRCNGQNFFTWYNANDNRYIISTDFPAPPDTTDPEEHIRVNLDDDPKFQFKYFLECIRLNSARIDNTPIPPINLQNQPIQTRIHIYWHEYGQDRNFYLTNILTNLVN